MLAELLTIGLLISGLLPYTESAGVCPIDFVEHSGVCVIVLITPILNTWRQTEIKCLDLKSSMLMVKSKFEWDTIIVEAAMHFENIPAGVWLGLNYTKSDDKYYWFDGAEHSPLDDWNLWGPEETDQRPTDNKCALIERTGEEQRPFEWILVDCENRHMMGIGVCVVPRGSYPDGTEWGMFSVSLIVAGIIAALLSIRWIVKRLRRKADKHIS